MVEMDEEIAAACRSSVSPRLVSARVVVGKSGAQAAGRQLIRRWALRRVVMAQLSGGARLHSDAYRDLEARLSAEIRQFWANRGTEIRLSRRWVSNLFRNLSLPVRSVDELRGWLGERVVLLGAGPNLERVLPDLQHRNCPLVAIDTALPVLAAAGIRPELVVAMDGQLANARDFCPWQWDDLILVADMSAHPSMLRRIAADRRFGFVSRFSDAGLFDDPAMQGCLAGLPVVAPRGSVAPAALELLVARLGVREVLCAGVDFWYQPPRSHARMSTIDRFVRRTTRRLLHRDGYGSALRRPWKPVTLVDGAMRQGDGVLADQAERMRELAEALPVRLLRVAGPGLDIGAETLDKAGWKRWLAGERGADSETGGMQPTGWHPPDSESVEMTEHAAKRCQALRAVLERLRQQELVLAGDGPVYLDAGLDMAWRDLPQWPLLERRADWAELHRARVLRAVRDLRRRLERLRLTDGPPD